MPKHEKFCGVENFGVLIPYRDLERLMYFANNFDRFEDRLSQIDRQLQGLRSMQADFMDKIGEIERSL